MPWLMNLDINKEKTTMSKRAEEAAKKKYPIYWAKAVLFDGNTIDLDANEVTRNVFRLGYEQAEKDIISLIESRISEIMGDAQPNPILRMELQGIIDKIK